MTNGATPTARDRHAGHYLSLVQRDPQDWQTIQAKLGQIRRAWEAVADDPQQVLAFTEALALFHQRQGLWREAISWAERGLHAAQILARDESRDVLLHNMGMMYQSLGDTRRALDH